MTVAVLAVAVVLLTKEAPPEQQVERYLSATSAGDEAAALETWVVRDSAFPTKSSLLERRTSMTRDLAARHAGSRYTITRVEWWRTCCEPGEIQRREDAGLARFHVDAFDRDGHADHLVFDVFVHDITWWGTAGGGGKRDWTLYEVYRENERCLFPSTAYVCVRS